LVSTIFNGRSEVPIKDAFKTADHELFPPLEEKHHKLLELKPGEEALEVYGRRLIDCVRTGQVYSTAMLIAHGASVNFQDERGLTPLHHAVMHGRSCTRVLIASEKCDYLIKDKKNRYAFELAIEWGMDYGLARLLITKQKEQAYAQGKRAWDKGIKLRCKENVKRLDLD